MLATGDQTRRLGRCGKACSLIVAGLAALSLWSWGAGVTHLFAITSSQVIQAPSTAGCLAFFSAIFFLRRQRTAGGMVRRYDLGVTAAVGFVGALACVRPWFGWRSPVEEWLAQTLDRIGDLPVGQMWPLTGALLLLAATAYWLQMFSPEPGAVRRRLAVGLAGMVLLAGIGAVISHASGLPWFPGGAVKPMALGTALAFIFLGCALLTDAARGRYPSGEESMSAAPLIQASNAASVLIAALLALVISTVTAVFLRREQLQDREDARQMLNAVGNLKLAQITGWRDERLNDARFIAQADFVSRDVSMFLEHPASGQARARLLHWLELLKRGKRYSVAAVFETNAALALATTNQTITNLVAPRQLMAEALRSNQVLMSDFHQDVGDPDVHIDVVLPVLAPASSSNLALPRIEPVPVGFVLLRLDPQRFLYPLLQSWPTHSRTAETVMFHREGDDVVFLNQLRHRTNSPMTLRFPIASNQRLPAAQALLGKTGQIEGTDYRGVPVVTDIRPVPGTSWFLVAKVDQEEIYAPLREEAWLTLVLTAVLTLTAGLLVGFTTKRQLADRALRELAAERKQLELAQRVEHLMRHANDAILLADEQDRILEANDRLLQTYGYSLAELQAMPLAELRAPEARAGFSEHSGQVLAAGRAVFETLHRRKDGSVFPVEISSSVIEVDGARYKLGILRDITQRRAHEREIERLNRLYATLSEVNQAIVRVQSRAELFENVCRIAVEFGGFKLAWIGAPDPGTHQVVLCAQHGDDLGYLNKIRIFADDRPEGHGLTGTCLRSGKPCISNDFLNDPRSAPWREAALAHDLRGAAMLPIHFNGTIWGCLSVYAREPDLFQDRELALLEEMALDVSFAMEQLQQKELRQNAESALRESEELYRTLVAASPNAITVTDLAGRTVFASAKALEMFGEVSMSDLTGRSVLEWVAPEDYERAVANVRRPLSDDQFLETEYILIRKDGTRFNAEVTVGVVRDSKGNPKGKIVVTRDITARKQAETALRESEERFRGLYENTTVGIYRTTPQGEILLANPALVKLLGYDSFAELAARNLGRSGFEPSYERRQFLEIIEREGEVKGLEASWQRRDGTALFIRENARAIRDAAGQTLYYDGMVEDISQRKLVEEQVRKLSRAVEQSSSSIVITNRAGEVEYVNHAFTHVTGYSPAEVQGQNPRVLKSGHTNPADYQQLWETILQGREWRGEFYNKKKNGELFWEFASISPIVDEAGHITHFVAVKEDITERKRLEAQLRQAQKMEAVGQLAGGVAHDFNNILAAIMLHLGLLRGVPDLDPFLADSLQELESETKRAAGLTRQLLQFSRRSVMQVQPVDLNETVENLLKMLRRLIGEQVNLEWQSRSGLPAVSGDTGMLEQVVMNLVVNARDAMPNGGRIILATDLVELDANQAQADPEARPGQFVCLSVSDNGCGMDTTVLKRIFEPFFTTKETGKGTGLGLATVYGIAKQHQGWATVESTVGAGSTFRVFLPALAHVAHVAEPNQPAPPLARGEETILLVEDEPSVRKIFGTFLRSCGYRVLEATNGAEALGCWSQHGQQIDLLCTDMVMPGGMNGLQLTQKLRATKPGLKVIISSGYSADLVQQSNLVGLGIMFLPKPSPPDVLASVVRRCLDQPRA